MGLTFRHIVESTDRTIPVPVSHVGFEPTPFVASLALTRYRDSGLAEVSVYLYRPGDSGGGAMPCHSLSLLEETDPATARRLYEAVRRNVDGGHYLLVLRADGALRLRVGTRWCFGPRPKT